MEFMIAPIFPDTAVVDSDWGYLLKDIFTLATAAGCTIQLYTTDDQKLLLDYMKIPLIHEAVAIKFVNLEKEEKDMLVVLDSTGVVTSYGIDANTYAVTSDVLFKHEMTDFRITKTLVTVHKESGTLFLVTGIGCVTVLDVNKPGYGSTYVVGVDPINTITAFTANQFAVLEAMPLKLTRFHSVLVIRQDKRVLCSPQENLETQELELLGGPITEEEDPLSNQLLPSRGVCWSNFYYDLAGEFHFYLNFGSPFAGIIFLGPKKVAYLPYNLFEMSQEVGYAERTIEHLKNITAVAPYGDRMFVVGTATGHAYLLMLKDPVEPLSVNRRIMYKKLGRPVVATTITSIADNIFFGSSSGPSMLYRMGGTNVPNTYHDLIPLQTIENIGPVSDSAVVPHNDRLRVVFSGGKDQEGSLTAVEYSVKQLEMCPVVIGPVVDVFSPKFYLPFHKWIVASSVDGTKGYYMSGNVLEPAHHFDSKQATLAFGSFEKMYAGVQVTRNEMIVHFREYDDQVWKSSRNEFSSDAFDVAMVNEKTKEVYAVSGNVMRAYNFQQVPGENKYNVKVQARQFYIQSKITCLDLVHAQNGRHFLVIGFQQEDRLVVIDAMTFSHHFSITLQPHQLDPNSVVATETDLLFSTPAGVYCCVDFNIQRKEGSQFFKAPSAIGPFKLSHLDSDKWSFVASALNDETQQEGFLVEKLCGVYYFPSFNSKSICRFDSEDFRESFVVSDGEAVQIVKLTEESYCTLFGENVKKIAAQPFSKTIAVVTSRQEPGGFLEHYSSRVTEDEKFSELLMRIRNRDLIKDEEWIVTQEKEVTSIVLVHIDSFDTLFGIGFGPYEYCRDITSGLLTGSSVEYYAALTILDYGSNADVYGSIILMEAYSNRSKLTIVDVFELKSPGEPGTMGFRDGDLIVTLGTVVYTLSMDSNQRLFVSEELDSDGTITNMINESVSMASIPSVECAAMPSVSSMSVELASESLIEAFRKSKKLAHEYLAAAGMISNTHIHGVSAFKQVHTFGLNFSDDKTMEEAVYGGMFYVGRAITSIRATSALHIYYEEIPEQATGGNALIFGTTSGYSGWIFRLQPEWAAILRQIETAIEHSEDFSNRFYMYLPRFKYRADNKLENGFVDGEKIRLLMTMPHGEIKAILRSVEYSPESWARYAIKDISTLFSHLKTFHGQYSLRHRYESVATVLPAPTTSSAQSQAEAWQ